MGDMSPNFSRAEFACKCGCGLDNISPDQVKALQELRDNLGVAIHILSGCRCLAHNAAVGGVPNSQHLPDENGVCHASDITCRYIPPTQLKGEALKVSAFDNGGIGLYPGFVHVDVGPKRRWYG